MERVSLSSEARRLAGLDGLKRSDSVPDGNPLGDNARFLLYVATVSPIGAARPAEDGAPRRLSGTWDARTSTRLTRDEDVTLALPRGSSERPTLAQRRMIEEASDSAEATAPRRLPASARPSESYATNTARVLMSSPRGTAAASEDDGYIELHHVVVGGVGHRRVEAAGVRDARANPDV